MAVNLSVIEFARELRIGDGITPLDAAQAATMGQRLGAASAMVLEYLPDRDGVDYTFVHNEAAIRAGLYLNDADPSRSRRFADVLAESGALSVLRGFRVQRALVLDGTGVLAAGVPAVGGLDAAQVNLLIQTALATYVNADALTAHAALANVHHIPPEIMPSGDVVAGISPEGALALIKEFARTGSTVFPVPADLAPNAQSGRVLGMRTAGGTLETSWVEVLLGSPHLILNRLPTADEIAVGGLVPSGGLVFVERPNLPLVIYNRFSSIFDLVPVASAAQPFVEPGDDGMLPPAADFPNRIALAGNQLLWSRGAQGTDKQVGFANYGPTRPEPPARSAQELIFAGSFAQPPTGNFVTGAVAWDYGSEVWLQNQTNDDDDWASYSGPLGYHHGNLYLSNADAAVHVPDATYIGRVYVIGHGSGQRPRVVVNFTAPTAPTHEWIPLGIQINDVTAIVNAHNTAATPHAARLTTIEETSAAGDAALLAGYQAADAALTAAIAALQAVSGLTILPYSPTASHSLGGSNTFVTHASELLAYTHNAALSANHDPAQHPNYWANLTHIVTIVNVDNSSNIHFRRGMVILTHEDEVYLCATDEEADTARNLAFAKANSDRAKILSKWCSPPSRVTSYRPSANGR